MGTPLSVGPDRCYLLRVTVPTPHQHPGYTQHFYVSTKRVDYREEFRKIETEPALGQAWDAEQRLKYADWKTRFNLWLQEQPGITPLTFTEY